MVGSGSSLVRFIRWMTPGTDPAQPVLVKQDVHTCDRENQTYQIEAIERSKQSNAIHFQSNPIEPIVRINRTAIEPHDCRLPAIKDSIAFDCHAIVFDCHSIVFGIHFPCLLSIASMNVLLHQHWLYNGSVPEVIPRLSRTRLGPLPTIQSAC